MHGDPAMDIHVEITSQPVTLKGRHEEVIMIPFSGAVTGRLFQGTVENCGVDTQILDAAGVRRLSARYMMTGTDMAGRPARIYVENNAICTGGDVPMPFRSIPVFYTDSEALAPILHSRRFIGEGRQEADGLHILFFDLSETDA